MDIDKEVRQDCLNRLKRARGQLEGVLTMVEDGRSCADLVTQIAAVSKALERVGFKIIAAELRHQIEDGPDSPRVHPDIEKLFLSLA